MSSAFELRTNGETGVSYLECTPLSRLGFVNAFSLRKGGVSALPREALNLSYREDEPAAVAENRKRFLAAIESSKKLITAHQTHSDLWFHVDSGGDRQEEPACDALVGAGHDYLLAIQTADCLPVLVGDPQSGIIAAIHAGWRGTVARIVEKTIQDLVKRHGIDPQNVLTALGPAACGGCYEVGADVRGAFDAEFPYASDLFSPSPTGQYLLDVAAANRRQLRGLGVPDHQIFVSDHCTMHNNDLFFSYRKESNGGRNRVGRQLSVISVPGLPN